MIPAVATRSPRPITSPLPTTNHLPATARIVAVFVVLCSLVLGGCWSDSTTATYYVQGATTLVGINQPVALTVTKEIVLKNQSALDPTTSQVDPAGGTWIIDPSTGASVVDGAFIATEPGNYTVEWKPSTIPDDIETVFTEAAYITVNADAAPADTPTAQATTAPAADRSAEAIAVVKARQNTCIAAIAATLPNGAEFSQSATAALNQMSFTATPVEGTSATYSVVNNNGIRVTVNLDAGTAVIENPEPSEACLSYFD